MKYWAVAVFALIVPRCLLAASYTPLERSEISAQLTEERGRITLDSGNEVLTRIRIPKAEGPVPTVLILAGFQEPTKGLDVLLPNSSVALASLEYPFYGNKRFRGMEAVRYIPAAKSLLNETLEALEVFQKVLTDHPSLDSQKLVICGTSFGSVFASLAAKRWPESFKGLVLIHGFGDLVATSEFLLTKKLERSWGFGAKPAAWLIARLFWLYLGAPSPEKELRNLKASQSVLLIDAEDDHQIPSQARDSLWSSIQSSAAESKRVTLGNVHITAENASLLERVSIEVKNWMSLKGW